MRVRLPSLVLALGLAVLGFLPALNPAVADRNDPTFKSRPLHRSDDRGSVRHHDARDRRGDRERDRERDRDRDSRRTANARSLPTLTITDVDRGLGPVPRSITGGNLRWVGRADGAFDPRRGQIRTDTARLVRRIRLGAIRYAGGTVANMFDHRRAQGKPQCQTSGGYLRRTYARIDAKSSGYTLGRHAAFAKESGTITNLMIPMVNTTVERAVDYVRDMAALTGTKTMHVELGNEPYLPNQRYWRSKKLGQRLNQYIFGGSPLVDGQPGDHSLFRVGGCDLTNPAKGNGKANQTYRTRFYPISVTNPPRVWVDGVEWTYNPAGVDTGLFPRAHEFTVSPDRTRIIFSDGFLAAYSPEGALRISYRIGQAPGFKQFYTALKNIPGLNLKVCSSWGRQAFVNRMAQLGLPYDCLAVHSYSNINGPTSNVRVFKSLMRETRESNSELARLRNSMRASGPGASSRFLNVTEYGGRHRKRARRTEHTPFMREMVTAVHAVGQIATGVRVSNISNFDSLFERYDDRLGLSGQAYVLGLVHRLVGLEPVVVKGMPDGVVVAAARSGKRVSLLAVNTSWDEDKTVRFSLPGRTGATCVTTRMMRAHPAAITRPRTASSRPLSVLRPRIALWRRDALKHTFPSHSIQLVTFAPRSGGRCPGATMP